VSQQRHRQVVAAVLSADRALSVAQVEAAVAAVAGHPAALRSLAAALRADPGALAIGAPPMIGRLVSELRAHGANVAAGAQLRALPATRPAADPILGKGRGLRPLPTP